MSLTELSAADAVREINAGEISSEDLVTSYLERIEEVDREVQAWAHLDRDYALAQARACDAARQMGRPLGLLHGVPVGVKDIFDTSDLPTENGTALDSGRRPKEDCTVVALLRQAGAVIMGKTVTTELAVYHPGKTRNPHNPEHTPGGSSSGSAAAVAAGMVPLAVGSQTNGSIIRPGAYCGVVGFKPTLGLISRHGVLAQSHHLDTVGVYARSVEDAALIADVLAAYDSRDLDMRPRGRPHLLETAQSEPPLDPVFAFVKTPVWDQAEDDTREAFEEIAGFLAGEIEAGQAADGAADGGGDGIVAGPDEIVGCAEIELPSPFDQAIVLHRTIMLGDFAKSFAGYYQRGKAELSGTLREMIEEGQTVLAMDYNAAVDWIGVLNAGLEEIFELCDAILTPATTGPAPKGLDATGSPVFCTLWTLCGTPAITLPLMQGADGLPLGVQLVGRRGEDARLLRTARWLMQRVESAEQAS
ncbi:MAG: amidase [Alphaproteobacteria bacterium]|nr:amidase [Alphaproteobacteria bacterium]